MFILHTNKPIPKNKINSKNSTKIVYKFLLTKAPIPQKSKVKNFKINLKPTYSKKIQEPRLTKTLNSQFQTKPNSKINPKHKPTIQIQTQKLDSSKLPWIATASYH